MSLKAANGFKKIDSFENIGSSNSGTLSNADTHIFVKSAFYLAPLIFGALLPLAFSPFDWWPFAILSPALLLFFWRRKNLSPKQAFFLGLSYGIGMFGVGVSWVFVSIHRFGGTDVPLALFIMSLLVVLLALFIAIQGYLLKRFFRGNDLLFLFLGFPSSFVLCEWVRSIAFTGFPWLFLGYTQLETPLGGYAAIGSVYLVSLMVALSAASLVAISIAVIAFIKGSNFKGRNFKDDKDDSFKGSNSNNYRASPQFVCASLLLVLIWSGGAILKTSSWTKPFSRAQTVSLVQANIPPLQKFESADPIAATEQSYGKLSIPYWGRDIIIWPESAVPVPLPYSKSYLERLAQLASNSHTTFITGTQMIDREHNKQYNSLIALGNGSGLYHKHHLLPYGDYLPFETWLRGLIKFFDLPMSSFSPGSKEQDLITAGEILLNPQICYEIAFPELIRETLRNAHAIITLSEDGWFGDSIGPHQHLQIARMRALETGKPVIRATTSGITAIIGHDGKLLQTIPQFQAAVLDGSFQPMQGETLWTIIGLWPLLLILVAAFILPGRFYKTDS